MERKKHLIGFETEMILLEKDGSVSTRADLILKKAQKIKLKYPVHKEYTHNMIEVVSPPNVKIGKIAKGWLHATKRIISESKKSGIRLYPYGIYFGTHVPTCRTDKYYRMNEDVMGPKKFSFAAGHVAGFHFHYCLPYNTFNKHTKNLKRLFKSKYKEQLLNVYNSIIAIDPAISNFMESSPFVDGEYIAKDSRIFLYRAMRLTKNKESVKGLYYDLEMFGRLPRYMPTISDLIMLVEKRHNTWMEIVENKYPEYKDIVENRHPLQFNWGPLRINKIGTFEYRGMDMNMPSNLIGTSLLTKYFLEKIRRDGLTVKPSDIGIKEPFKIENEIIHVPPYAYLSEVLQYKSALHGLEDNEVNRYTKSFVATVFKELPSKKDKTIWKIKNMLKERKTESDIIIEEVKKKCGFVPRILEEEIAKELALEASKKFEKEIISLSDENFLIDEM